MKIIITVPTMFIQKLFLVLINMYMATARNVEVILHFCGSRHQYGNPIKTL